MPSHDRLVYGLQKNFCFEKSLLRIYRVKEGEAFTILNGFGFIPGYD
jgi:hypothetical protein